MFWSNLSYIFLTLWSHLSCYDWYFMPFAQFYWFYRELQCVCTYVSQVLHSFLIIICGLLVFCWVNAFCLLDFLEIWKILGDFLENYDVLAEFIGYISYFMVSSAMLWLIFCSFCSFLMLLSRITACLRLFFTGFT